jgi:putative membrane protein
MKIILHWIIISATVYGLAYFVPNISISIWWVALIIGAILYFIHQIVKPIIKILTLPINLLTFGLFSIVLNVLFFWFPSVIISGFKVQTLTAALIGGIVISIVNSITERILESNL